MISDKPRPKQREKLCEPKADDADQDIKKKRTRRFSALLLSLPRLPPRSPGLSFLVSKVFPKGVLWESRR